MINAIMLGLSRREVRERFDAIIDFAELQEFLDLRLKNYSSGMLVRLAFSVAIQVVGGDPADRRGAGGRRRQLPAEVLRRVRAAQAGRPDDPVRDPRHGRGRALLRPRDAARERGDMVGIGEPAAIARRYNELNFGRTSSSGRRRRAGPRRLDRTCRRRSSTRGSRTPTGDADRRARARRALLRRASRSASTSRSTIRSSA